MPLPPLTETGDLPPGVHVARLTEVLDRCGGGTIQRQAVALRLNRISRIAAAIGDLARLVVFGSFVTAKPEPADVDVFPLMEDIFDASRLTAEARLESAFDAGLITAQEADLWRRFNEVRRACIMVEDFPHDLGRSVAAAPANLGPLQDAMLRKTA